MSILLITTDINLITQVKWSLPGFIKFFSLKLVSILYGVNKRYTYCHFSSHQLDLDSSMTFA